MKKVILVQVICLMTAAAAFAANPALLIDVSGSMSGIGNEVQQLRNNILAKEKALDTFVFNGEFKELKKGERLIFEGTTGLDKAFARLTEKSIKNRIPYIVVVSDMGADDAEAALKAATALKAAGTKICIAALRDADPDYMRKISDVVIKPKQLTSSFNECRNELRKRQLISVSELNIDINAADF